MSAGDDGQRNHDERPLPHEAVPPGDEDAGGAVPGADESVEQYVRLQEHIEHLRAERRPPRPEALTPEEARVLQMAALFHAAAPDAMEPDPDFLQGLLDQLEHQGDRGQEREHAREPARETETARQSRRQVSRRSALRFGLGAAAGLAAGVAAGVGIEQALHQPASGTGSWEVSLVPAGTGMWLAVARVDEMSVGSVRRFQTEALVGFVRRTAEGFVALSGACTHMGCTLWWNPEAATFDCPCHGGRFTADGQSAPSSPVAYRPLPKLQTKVDAGQVWVYVPATGTTTAPQPRSSGPYQP